MKTPISVTYNGFTITAQDGRWVVTEDGEYRADFPKLHNASAWIDQRTAPEPTQDPWRTT
mgnify:CR=1 FL=1